MKTIQSFFKVLIIMTLYSVLISCHSDPYSLDTFLIKVDSIHVPMVITSNTSFDIDFFGTIGGDGCYSFGEFLQTFINNDIMIEARGNYDSKAKVCPTVMVYLTGHKMNLTIPASGIYYLRIKLPDNKYLVKQITVN